MPLHYLNHSEINKAKWDEALERSQSPLVYAYSWYLDCVAPGWSALVLDDYMAIFPIPEKQKWGIRYALHPLFAQQLGWFVTPGHMVPENWHKALPKHLQFVWLQLNAHTSVMASGYKKNYVLRNLHEGRPKATTNTRRNIKKAKGHHLIFSRDITLQQLLAMKRRHATNLSEARLQVLSKLLQTLLDKQKGELAGVKDDKGELLAVVFLAHSFNRLIYLMAASTDEGRQKRAMFYLVDQLLKKVPPQFFLFDFEGGNNPNLARFFQGFGAEEEQIPLFYASRLPWPLSRLLFRKLT